MDWMLILSQIFELCIIPLLGILTAQLVAYIKSKSQEVIDRNNNDTMDKYIAMLADTISACVTATNQTYVESLKKENLFNKEAQKEAFEKTLQTVMTVLSDDAKIYLSNIYGDLTTYISQKIEAEVKNQK